VDGGGWSSDGRIFNFFTIIVEGTSSDSIIPDNATFLPCYSADDIQIYHIS
jgi:hypothetical protein